MVSLESPQKMAAVRQVFFNTTAKDHFDLVVDHALSNNDENCVVFEFSGRHLVKRVLSVAQAEDRLRA
jgi:hypothetical protein